MHRGGAGEWAGVGGHGITCGDVGTDMFLVLAMTHSVLGGLSGFGIKITEAKLSSESILVSLWRLSFEESVIKTR